jgi:formylglycine-generating enzyme required for sulfatase activity
VGTGQHSELSSSRGLRGASWNNNSNNLAASNRNDNTATNENNNMGFRVARPPAISQV